MAKGTKKKSKSVETLVHDEAARRNIPTAEFHSVIADKDKAPIRVAYERRNRDLDPQLVWRGKDEQDAADLVVQAPPLYIQEKVHPKVLIDDLLRQTKERREEEAPTAPDLFADFNGLPDGAATTEFYRHDANWSNRMILGDSLQAMASLAEREPSGPHAILKLSRSPPIGRDGLPTTKSRSGSPLQCPLISFPLRVNQSSTISLSNALRSLRDHLSRLFDLFGLSIGVQY